MKYSKYNIYKKNIYILYWLLEVKRIVPLLLCMLIGVLVFAFSCKDNSSNISSSGPYFPIQKAGLVRMDSFLEGRLGLENDCLRVKDNYNNYLIIWPHGFSLHTEGEKIQVIDNNGQVFAYVGDRITVGGGEIPGEEARELIEKYYIEIPLPDNCQGPYWIIGEVIYNGIDLGVESSDTVSSDEIDEDDELFFAEIYAEQYGITTDEALERFRFQDTAGELSEELIIKEAGTLAGYWIEHTPEFKLVILFTRDAEETIKPYLQKYGELADIIEVGMAELSLVELQSIQNEVSSSIEELEILTASEINVYENRVKIYVVDRDQLDKAITEGKLILPDCVDVITVDSLEGELVN